MVFKYPTRMMVLFSLESVLFEQMLSILFQLKSNEYYKRKLHNFKISGYHRLVEIGKEIWTLCSMNPLLKYGLHFAGK